MRNLVISSAAIFCVFNASGCGKDAAKKAEEAAKLDAPDAAAIVADPEATSGVVATQVDDAVSSVAAGDAASGAAALTDSANLAPSTMARTRTCTPSTPAATASVKVDYSGSRTGGKEGKHTVTVTRSGSETRVWSKEGAVIGCKEGKWADINWASPTVLDKMKLSVTTTRKDELTHSFTKGETTQTFGKSSSDNGTRTITFAVSDSSKSKTITSKVEKTHTITKKDKSVKDLSSTVEVKAESPLVVTTTRDVLGKASAHTIISGTVYSTAKKSGAFYVSTSFANLSYDIAATAADACTPKSGSVTTKIYKSNSAADMATPLKTYVATYTDSVVAVTVNGTADETATARMDEAANKSCEFKEDSAG